ncbi:MAG: hypothetical protein EXS10_01050 [Phycisphaerales bacterium]|nr:hypothetical protein [Phycisphaerales bacterium]
MLNSLTLARSTSARPFARNLAGFPTGLLAGILAIGLLGSATLLGGCSDETVVKAQAFDAAFNAAAQKALATTDAFSNDPNSAALDQLKSLAAELSTLSGATENQSNAARALAASLYRKVGSAQLARAQGFEQDENTTRELALALADAAATLDGVAASYESADFTSTRNAATALRDQSEQIAQFARAGAGAATAQLGELDRQIAAVNSTIARLETESAVLLLKARQSGATAGYPFVAESARLTADASALKVSMSKLVAQLDAAAPLVQLASLKGEGSTSVQGAAESELDQLRALDGVLGEQAKLAHTLAGQLRDHSVATLERIEAERAGPLAEAYTAAVEALDQCSSLTRGSDASDALAMEVHVERTQLALSALRGMTEQARGYAVLANSGALFGGDAKYATQLDALKKSATERITALREQLQLSLDATQALGEDPQSVATKKWFDDAKKSADALDVEKLFTPPAPVEVAAAKPAAKPAKRSTLGSATAAATGFPTPEALAAAMNALRLDPRGDPTKCFSASSAGGQAMLGVMGPLLKELMPLREAVAEKFGAEALATIVDVGASMGMPSIGGLGSAELKVGEVSGDTGTLTDGTSTMPIMKIASGWLVDFNGMLEASGTDMAQMEQMAPMMKAGMAMVMPMMKKATASVIAQIKSGAITDPSAIGPAFEEALKSSMGGMMGGGGGSGSQE